MPPTISQIMELQVIVGINNIWTLLLFKAPIRGKYEYAYSN